MMSTAQFDDQDTDTEGVDLLTKIEKLILTCNRHCEMSSSLQASLKQLEVGFKRGYQDTLTLLNTQ